MATYYSPDGNPEVWDRRPGGYYTEDEWRRLHEDGDAGDDDGDVDDVPTETIDAADIKARVRARYAELALQAAGWEAHGMKQAEAAARAEMRALAFEYVKLLAAENRMNNE